MMLRSAQVVLTAVCLVFGILLMVQFRTQGKIVKTQQAESSADQAQIVSNLYDANVNLRKEIDALEAQLRERSNNPNESGELVADLEKYKIVNAVIPATGPGVELVVAGDIRIEDVQDLINEFRNAGSEALAVNGERITARTAIISERNNVMVNGHRVSSPFTFSAIGESDTIERALVRKGGLVGYIQNTYPEAAINVRKLTKLTVPSASAVPSFQFARPEMQPAKG